MSKLSRRTLLNRSLGATAAWLAAPGLLHARGTADRLSFAIIGCGSRGGNHLDTLLARDDCDVAYVCDADLARANRLADKAAAGQPRRPQVVQDLRRIFDDRQLDCATIATCNHWHALAAIWAMQAGLDVYVEKPLSWCIAEGRRIVETSRKHDRICQVGTQYRSDETAHRAKEFIDAGGIGEIRLIRTITYQPTRVDRPGRRGQDSRYLRLQPVGWPGTHEPDHATAIPLRLALDVGNRQRRPGQQRRAPRRPRLLGHQSHAARKGEHQPRRPLWILGRRRETPNTQVAIHDFGGITHVAEVRGLESRPFALPSTAIVYGTEDAIVLLDAGQSRVCDPDGKVIRKFEGPPQDGRTLTAPHFANFIAAVRDRDRSLQNAEVAQGHVSAAMCHLANNAYRLGELVPASEITDRLQRPGIHADVVELWDRTAAHLQRNGIDLTLHHVQVGPWLEFDPDSEQYVDHPQADRLLTRDYRDPFVVPAAGEV